MKFFFRSDAVRGFACHLGTLALLLAKPASAAQKTRSSAGDDLFTNGPIRHLRLEISAGNMNALRGTQFQRGVERQQRPSVPATVHEGTQVWTNVAVHLKGALGSFRPLESKPALTLNFDKLAKGQRFHGLEKISLNNSVQDASYLSEKLCREIYNAAGVPVPRADYATVELNGRPLGLFVLTEGWNKQFLGRYFRNLKGNFYDLGGGRDILRPIKANFGEKPDDHSALKALAAAAVEPDHATRMKHLDELLDTERFIKQLALDVMMWNWDGYAMNKNNFRIFHDLDSKRIVFFPHGIDQMFWKPNGPIMTGRAGLLAKSILETAEGRRRYLESFIQLRATIFNVSAMTNRIGELTGRLNSSVGKEGFMTGFAFASSVSSFRNRIIARARDIDVQLAGAKNLLRLDLDETATITNWSSRQEFGKMDFAKITNSPPALHLKIQGGRASGMWISTVWLEEGRYRLEARVRTSGVTIGPGDQMGGAGFRVWSTRKETLGPSWGWFPFGRSHDARMGGLIPEFGQPAPRLKGDTDWTDVTYEFELRQPLADLQIQCLLGGSAGEAWFDLASLKIRHTALSVSKASE